MTRSDLPAVAEIHVRAFPDSALTLLGPTFVTAYYAWQLEGPHEIAAFVAGSREEVGGFVVAGTFNGALGGFVRENLPALAWHVTTNPRLVANPRVRSRMARGAVALGRQLVKRARSRVRRAGGTPTSVTMPTEGATATRFGVLAIAVDPREQGTRVAVDLMRAAEAQAYRAHVSAMNLSVDPANARAVRFYEREGWHRDLGADGAWAGRMVKVPTAPTP